MIKVAVGILVRNNGGAGDREVLLCQRRADAKYPLKWEFPGGKVENGEEAADCVARELREELGITIGDASLLHRQEALYPDSGHYEVWYYLVGSVTGTPVNRVFNHLEWVAVGDLERYDILDGNRDVVGILRRRYNGDG